MANLNKVMLIGNLTKDPTTRHTARGTAVADLALAINRVWIDEQNQRQNDTTFVDVTVWGRQAELAKNYLSKGRGVYIEGRLQMDTWDDKETGKKRSKLKIIGENIQFLPDGRSQGNQSHNQYSNTQAPTQSYQPEPSPAPAPQHQPSPPMGASPALHEDFHDDDHDEIPF